MTDSSIENLNDEAPSDEKILFGDNDISSNMEDILNGHSYHDETVVNPNVEGDPLILSPQEERQLATQSNENIFSTVTLYVSNKNVVTVPQHILCAYWNRDLNMMSLRIYVTLIDLIPKHWKTKSADKDNDEPDKGGRSKNVNFKFLLFSHYK